MESTVLITLKSRCQFFVQLSIFTVLLFSFAQPGAFAQALQIDWEKTFGGKEKDFPADIIQTPDGGYLIGGYSKSDSTGSKTDRFIGKTDSWVVKTDQFGNKVWDKTFGGKESDFIDQVCLANDEGFLLFGDSFTDTTGTTVDSSLYSGRDFFVIKIDKTGGKVWEKRYGSVYNDDFTSMVKTKDGGYLLGGFIYQPDTFNCYGGTSFLAIKISEEWKVEWSFSFRNGCINDLRSVVLAENGGYLLAGTIKGGEIDGLSDGFGNTDFVVVRVDENGNKLWSKRFGGTGDDGLKSVIATQDGGFLLGGSSYSDISGNKESPSKGGYTDCWVVKIDSNGNKEWDKAYGGDRGEYLSDMYQLSNGMFYLAGSSYSTVSGDKSEDVIGLVDIWLLQIDNKGDVVYDKTIGGDRYDELTSFFANENGDLVLVAGSDSNEFEDKTEESYGDYDYWVVKLNSVISSVNNSTSLNETIKVFSNSGNVLIDDFEGRAKDVRVVDINGKEVAKFVSTEKKVVKSLSHLKAGLYFVHINTDQGELIKRIYK